jgi:GT2 family glycosyltransferase
MEQLTRQLSLKSEQVGELTRQVEAVSEESRRLREQVKELSSQMQRDNAEHAAREARQQELLEEFTDLVPPERLFRFVLDEPSSWHLNKPRVELRGWCFHRRGERLTGVRARINGCTVAGQHGLSRPDVARDYPRAAGATESGFVISLRAPLGKSRLAVEVLTERHGWVEVFSTTCRNPFLTGAIGRGLYLLRRRIQWHPRPSGVRRLNEDFEFTVDDPSRWKLRRRETLVRGWCFHRQGRKIVAVRVRVNGKEWIGRVGLRRADVGGDHPGFPEANASGFEIQCVAPRGRFTMTMEVKMEGGGWEAFCEARGRAPWARIFEEPALTYRSWVAEYDTLRKKDVKLINRRLSHLSYQPLISVLMPLYNTPEPWLRRALESVCEQVYPHWELCIGNDASTAPHVRRVLDEFARRDARIRVVHRPRNGHIVAASNSALELVRGEFIALMDSDDELPRHALYMVAEELNAHPDADLIYSDEDKMDDKGVRYEPYFKSELNPDLFLSQNLVNHLGVYRTSLVRELGGFLQEALGSQDYDLALRVLERTTPERVRHIPHVLYHWRAISGSGALDLNDKPYAHQAARTAIRTHLQRRGVQVEVVAAGVGQYHRVIYPLPTPRPPVTVIMLSGGKPQYLAMGLTSVLRKTNYDNLRLLLMPNRVQQPESLQLIEDARRDPRVTVLPYDDPFNFSRMNNLGVGKCTSELVVFFNDDLDVINGDWLDELVRHGVRPEVAAVGPMLFYPDNTIQHAGVVVGINGVASHVHKCFGRGQHGYFGRAGLIQNFSALTAGCLLMRRSVFQEVGGFDEELPVAFNDVDLCLRIREKGYLLTWTPYAQLYHHESVTLGRHDSPARAEQFRKETNYLKQRWKHILGADPYYSPNLSLKSEDFGLAFPPRVGKPWQRSGRGADGVVAK